MLRVGGGRRVVCALGASVLVALSLAGASASPALAESKTIDFDPDQGFVAGQILGTVGEATFVGSPKIFAPVHVATQTPPNALHPQQPCGATAASCAMEVTFAAPKTAVGLRVGLDDEAAGEFSVPYQLTGYDSGSKAVAQSNGSALLGAPGYDPITTNVAIQSLSTNIAKVVLQLGASSVFAYNTGYARRPAIDDFAFTDDALPPPAAPSCENREPDPRPEIPAAGRSARLGPRQRPGGR